MKTLSFLFIAATMLFTVAGVAEADGRYVRRPGYQQYHYAPRSYRSYDRDVYRRGYSGPSHGYYYNHGYRHYDDRTVYFSFFGLPIVTY